MGCNYWECGKLDQEDGCAETGGECLGDMCEDFQTCRSCRKRNSEGCPRY